MELTGGKGVDVVLNSLAGEFIPKTLSVVAKNGRFIEIGKAGIWSEQQMRESRPDVSYFPFDLGDFGHQHPETFQNMFAKLIAEFDKGFQKIQR